MKRSLLTTLVLVASGLSAVSAQPPPAAPVGAESPLAKLEFLAGSWRGEGRYFRGPQAPPLIVSVSEQATLRAGGTVLLLEGRGTVPGPDGQGETVVHDALGVLSWDSEAAVYRMRAFRDGNTTDAVVEVGDGSMAWGFHDPVRNVDVRFTMTLDAQGRWTEVGEVDRGEAGKLRFFEMTLARVDGAPAN